MEDNGAGALQAAREWLKDKGWNAADYHIESSSLQSCPLGCTSVDVTCLSLGDSDDPCDLLKRSRVLEIDNSTHKVETELAARDMTRLKRMLELESVRVQTEMMQQKLDDGHVDEEEREISADELLFEQDPQVRLEQLEQEISRVRGVQMKIQSDSSAQLVNEDDSDLGVASRLAPDEAEEAP